MQCQKIAYRHEKFDVMDKSMHDSEKMWKEFRKFSETRAPRSTIDEKISASEWKTHFETLHSENREQVVPVIVENRPTKTLNKYNLLYKQPRIFILSLFIFSHI